MLKVLIKGDFNDNARVLASAVGSDGVVYEKCLYSRNELMDLKQQIIVNKYKFGHEDIQIFANMAECIDYLKSEKIKTRSADGETALWCTLAVVGSVGTTLSATAIATPAGLAGWLFFKAVSIASIAGCV